MVRKDTLNWCNLECLVVKSKIPISAKTEHGSWGRYLSFLNKTWLLPEIFVHSWHDRSNSLIWSDISVVFQFMHDRGASCLHRWIKHKGGKLPISSIANSVLRRISIRSYTKELCPEFDEKWKFDLDMFLYV